MKNYNILIPIIVSYSSVVIFELVLGLQSKNLSMIADSSIVIVDIIGYCVNLASEIGKIKPIYGVLFSISTLFSICTVLIVFVVIGENDNDNEKNVLNIVCLSINFAVDIGATIALYRFASPSIQIMTSKTHVMMDTFRTCLVMIQVLTSQLFYIPNIISDIFTIIICLTGYFNIFRIYASWKTQGTDLVPEDQILLKL